MLVSVYKLDDHELYYGSSEDYDFVRTSKFFAKDYATLLCAKNPYHKEIVGYEGNLSRIHPNYLVVENPEQHIMALNMIDAPEKQYFSDEMVLAGIDFIGQQLNERNVLVVCNKGVSRSPTMCLMYLMAHGDFEKDQTHVQVFDSFRLNAVNWEPNTGILQYCIEFWDKIRKGELA